MRECTLDVVKTRELPEQILEGCLHHSTQWGNFPQRLTPVYKHRVFHSQPSFQNYYYNVHYNNNCILLPIPHYQVCHSFKKHCLVLQSFSFLPKSEQTADSVTPSTPHNFFLEPTFRQSCPFGNFRLTVGVSQDPLRKNTPPFPQKKKPWCYL